MLLHFKKLEFFMKCRHICKKKYYTYIIQLLKAKLLINISNNFNNGYEYECSLPYAFK